MSTAIFTTQINHRYLMNKSKSDMADLTMWILDMKCKEQEAFDKLLSKVTECLDDENIKGAMDLLREYEKAHEPFDK
jgi:hypothetical protein